MARVSHFRELDVYQEAMGTCMSVFELTKGFPAEGRFSLREQIRPAARSVCANIGEAWRKRRYKAAFVSKLSDAESEAAETQVWLEIAFKCGYLREEDFRSLDDACDKAIGQVVKMIDEPEKWMPHSSGRQ